MTTPTNPTQDELLVVIQVSLPMDNDGNIVVSPDRLKSFIEAHTQQAVSEAQATFAKDIAVIINTTEGDYFRVEAIEEYLSKLTKKGEE